MHNKTLNKNDTYAQLKARMIDTDCLTDACQRRRSTHHRLNPVTDDPVYKTAYKQVHITQSCPTQIIVHDLKHHGL